MTELEQAIEKRATEILEEQAILVEIEKAAEARAVEWLEEANDEPDEVDVALDKVASDRAGEVAAFLEKEAEDLDEAIEQMALLKVACWVAGGMEKEAGAKKWLAGATAAACLGAAGCGKAAKPPYHTLPTI